MRWDLVIFDCDGVLIDSELLSVRAGQECLAACGIELTEAELLERYTGISFAGMMADIEARHGPLPADFDDRHSRRLWPLFEREPAGHPRHRRGARFADLQDLRRLERPARAIEACLVAGGPLRPLSPAHLQRRRGRARQARPRPVP